MAQLTTISNILDLQGTTLAKHALLLDGEDGSAASGARPRLRTAHHQVSRAQTALAVTRT
jgi:hypothetical protein